MSCLRNLARTIRDFGKNHVEGGDVLDVANGEVKYEKDTLHIPEDRPRAYREALAAFLSDVAGAPVSTGKQGVIVSAKAARKLSLGRDGPFRD